MNECQLPSTDLRGKLMLQTRDQIVVKLNSNNGSATGQECFSQESEPWANF
jgi:hypothetical protein